METKSKEEGIKEVREKYLAIEKLARAAYDAIEKPAYKEYLKEMKKLTKKRR